MPHSQSELRIFISSTFHDLAEEREYLVKKVFPEIRQLCRERGVQFTEIDLRWGLTEEEALQGKVIRTCLEEIDRCRPYFIGIIGSRYGWTPKYSDIQRDAELLRKYAWVEDEVLEGKSLVEMEFDYGALRNPESAEFAFFYELREHSRSRRSHSEIGKEEKEKLESLRSRIQHSGLPVREFSGPETLGEHVYNDLAAIVEGKWQKEEELLPLDRERLQHETFAASRRHAYISNPENTKALTQAAESGKQLIIHGESGAGKSALLAYWAHYFRQKNPKSLIIEHYVGIGSGADHIGLLTHIMSEIKDHLKLEEEIPIEPEKIVSDFPLWLSRLPEGGAVLVIDALNQLSEASHHLGWIPEHLPDNIGIIASTTSEDMVRTLASRGWQTMSLKPLQPEEREAIIVRFLSEYHKALSSQQLNLIAHDPKSASPLFLRTVLEELRIIGNFDKLDTIISHYIGAKDLDDLFQKVLERMEEDYGSRTVRNVMSLLYASRHGLSEHELDDIIPISRARLAAFLMALDYHLHRLGGLLAFFHDYLRRAVEARYAATPERKKKLHEHIAQYMSAHEAPERRAEEEPWQWLQAGNWEKFGSCLRDIPVLERLLKDDKLYELIHYWVTLRENLDSNFETRYTIEKFESECRDEERLADLFTGLGKAFITASLYRTAEIFLQKAVEIRKKIYGEKDDKIAESMNELATVYYYTGEFAKAELLFQEIISIRTEILGKGDPKTAKSINDLASVYYERGKFDEAEKMFRDALSSYESYYKAYHPEIASTLNNIASVLSKQGKYKEAIPYLERSIKMNIEVYGTYNQDTAKMVQNLGLIQKESRDYKKAEDLYKKAIEMQKNIFGSEHPNVAKSIINLASLQRELGNYTEAEISCKETLRIFLLRKGEKHPETLTSYMHLAWIYRDAHMYEEATTLYEKYLPLIREIIGENHDDYKKPLARYKEMLEKINQ